jgi:hypothetical protein
VQGRPESTQQQPGGWPTAPQGTGQLPVRSRRWGLVKIAILAVAGILVGLVAAGILANLVGVPAGRTPLSEVAVGECFDGARFGEGEAEQPPVEVIDCAQPHDGQVFATVAWQGSDQGVAYPGEDQVNDFALSTCTTEVRQFVDVVDRFPGSVLAYTYPQSDDWALGEREFRCIVQGAPGQKLVGDVMSPAG